MISNRQFRKYIVQPACRCIDAYSREAEEILIATMAHESLGGTYLVQETAEGNRVKGGAISFFQIQENAYDDVIEFAKVRPKYIQFIRDMNCNGWVYETMLHDIFYSAIIARFNYMRFPEPLPAADDINAIWEYYSKYWNRGGKAKKDDFILHYRQFTGGVK